MIRPLKRPCARLLRDAARIASLAMFMMMSVGAHAQDAAQPYLGQIFAVSFDFAPRGFALCNGQLLPINQNQALFALLGTTYGGDGKTNFALPDLRGRVAVHAPTANELGVRAGEETHSLIQFEMPLHTHQLLVSADAGTSARPDTGVIARDASGGVRYGTQSSAAMHPSTLKPAGGSQPHENRMPFVVVHYIIALQGIFPARN